MGARSLSRGDIYRCQKGNHVSGAWPGLAGLRPPFTRPLPPSGQVLKGFLAQLQLPTLLVLFRFLGVRHTSPSSLMSSIAGCGSPGGKLAAIKKALRSRGGGRVFVA